MLDQNEQVWLLEVNGNPGTEFSSALPGLSSAHRPFTSIRKTLIQCTLPADAKLSRFFAFIVYDLEQIFPFGLFLFRSPGPLVI